MEFTRRRYIATAGLAALAGCTSGVDGGTERASTTAAGSNPDRSTSNSDSTQNKVRLELRPAVSMHTAPTNSIGETVARY